jgi:PadR family transcriptional regulator PadR
MNDNTESSLIGQSASQMRKGVLTYAVLLLLKDGKVYSSEIIRSLRQAELIVVEGTLYPLLSRLAKDDVLAYEWKESEQGPPRKYYWLTKDGKALLAELRQAYRKLHRSIEALEKGTKK